MSSSIADPAERARQRRSCELQDQLYQYKAVMHGPCEQCGCLIWARVAGGFRCLHCAPPLGFPERLRQLIAQTLPPAAQEPMQEEACHEI